MMLQFLSRASVADRFGAIGSFISRTNGTIRTLDHSYLGIYPLFDTECGNSSHAVADTALPAPSRVSRAPHAMFDFRYCTFSKINNNGSKNKRNGKNGSKNPRVPY